MLEFNFGNALMHFSRTDAPRGFTWKYLLSYVVITLGLFLGMGALVGVSFNTLSAFGSQSTAGGLMIFSSFLLIAIFEASWQRRYVRNEGFKLRLAGDEFRLVVVYLIWILFFTLCYIFVLLALGAVIGIFSTGGANPVLAVGLGTITGLLAGCYWIYLAVRLSAASALTIRDRQIRFAASWRVTKGRFWPLLGAHLVMLVGVSILGLVLTGIGFGLFGNTLAALEDPSDFAATLQTSGLGIGLVVFYAFYYVFSAWWLYFWGGPAALAARTDPDYAGYADPAEAFS